MKTGDRSQRSAFRYQQKTGVRAIAKTDYDHDHERVLLTTDT